MTKTYYFRPEISGVGNDLNEAWLNAVDALALDPGDPPLIDPSPDQRIRVEYDLSYNGGNYSDVGDMAYIPIALVNEHGIEQAFKLHTGHDSIQIIHYETCEADDAV